MIRLDCYLPGRAGEDWARLRHLGARRFALVADVTSCMQQAGDLLGCAWPAPLAAVRRELPRWGGTYVRHSIVKGLREALGDTGGVAAQRRGALERLHLLLEDWRALRARLADTEARMTAMLDDPGLTELVTSIDGVSALSGAVMLAETGDLNRFTSGRAVVKHAGLNPSGHTSATINGQARTACAATLLRWLRAVITTRTMRDARIAAGEIPARPAMTAAAAA